jgi:hypothetical protein
MRRAGVLPYARLADNTRWMRKPRTYGLLQACLRRTAATYRRAVWTRNTGYPTRGRRSYVQRVANRGLVDYLLGPSSSRGDAGTRTETGYRRACRRR